MVDKEEIGASLFSRTLDIMENDPLEEIFALNMGDFISEFLISEELAGKISKSAKDKTSKLKSQLKELVSIYSLENTLCVLDLESKDEYVVYNSIAKTLTQILDVDACHIYLTNEFTRGLNFDDKFLGLVGSSIDFDEDIYGLDIKIEFVGSIRKEKKFPSMEALKEQLQKDKDFAAVLLKEKMVKKLR